jgi:phage-related protein
MDFEIEFFRTSSGRAPVQELLAELRRKQPVLHNLGNAGLQKLRNRQNHRRPLTTKVDSGNDIWELRVGHRDILRIFYFHAPNNRLVLTNGYVKKSQKLDQNQLDTAIRRKREWEERHHGK